VYRDHKDQPEFKVLPEKQGVEALLDVEVLKVIKVIKVT
jgi:hypothetical protein